MSTSVRAGLTSPAPISARPGHRAALVWRSSQSPPSHPGRMPPDDSRPSDEAPTSPAPEVPSTQPQGSGYPEPGWFSGPPEPSEPSAPPATRRPRTAVVVLSAVLVLVLVASGLLLARMFATTRAWEDSTAGWQRLAHEN